LSLFVPSHGYISQLKGQDADTGNAKRVSEISQYLNKNSQPDDLIQPLDWVGGTAEALFESRRNIATKFVYDFHFYHDVSNPYILKLKKEFIEEIKFKNPKFIIRTTEERAIPTGPDTTPDFPELTDFIKQNYLEDLKGEGYIIYKHN
jgi:hypothetical protein